MDWNKAKNYLIIALVVLNGVLILSIINHNNMASIDNVYFSKKTLTEFYEILNRKNIKIDCDIPKDIYNIGTTTVEYQTINAENYPLFFHDYKDKLEVESLKKLTLVDTNIVITDENTAQTYIQNFISKYMPGQQYAFKNILKNENGMTFFYNPVYDGFIYEESFLKFEFTENGMFFAMIVMKPLDVSSTRRDSITSVEAILKVFPEIKEGSSITQIDFIYYFVRNTDEELYKVKNARAFPTWRIKTDDGLFYYSAALEN